jgi:hypothetical protein
VFSPRSMAEILSDALKENQCESLLRLIVGLTRDGPGVPRLLLHCLEDLVSFHREPLYFMGNGSINSARLPSGSNRFNCQRRLRPSCGDRTLAGSLTRSRAVSNAF